MIKNVLVVCVVLIGSLVLLTASVEAGGRCGGYSPQPAYGYSNYYGGFHNNWSHQNYGHSHNVWHNTSHYDYHPGYLQPHRNHFHYVPGHYDYHQTGHWDHLHH